MASSSTRSSCLEKILEHRFIADVGTALWSAGIADFDVLRSEVDLHGHDVVIEVGNVTRHVQLKMTTRSGRRQRISVNKRLADKPSGCIIWASYDPQTLEIGPFRWFGAGPGEPLPDLGERIAKHTRANSVGMKPDRPGHRILGKGQFRVLEDLVELVEVLFGIEVPPKPGQ